ncbi:MAG: DUF6062 family protein [Thaumarchaeota archaeon]|jgi:hypothetical protein|nr:DUF6062 family protein [Candidatus Wolframiiraptor allenii]
MKGDREKDVVYVSLKSALMEEGCPICLLVSKRRDQWIETLFYELITSSETRKKLRERGFCTHHLWYILEYLEENLGIDGLGISIILHDLLSTSIELLEGMSVPEKRSECLLCSIIEEYERDYLNSLAEWITTQEFMKLFSEGDSVFCLPHLAALLREIDGKHKLAILKIQLEKMKGILERLELFINKSDYRYLGNLKGEEAKARYLASQVLGGMDL